MITKEHNLKSLVEEYPETGFILSKSGLHCVGCHASVAETIEDGSRAHGMTDKEINDLVNQINDRIKLFDSLDNVKFTDKALNELKKRLEKKKAKYIRIYTVYGGFDFDAVNEKSDDEQVLDLGIKFVADNKLLRFLKGVTIDFDSEKNDFEAKREN